MSDLAASAMGLYDILDPVPVEHPVIPDERGWTFYYNRLFDCGENRFIRNAFYDFKDAVNTDTEQEIDGDYDTEQTLPAWALEPVAWMPEGLFTHVSTLSLWMQHDYWAMQHGLQGWPHAPDITVLATHNRLRSMTPGDLARDPDGNYWVAASMGWARIEITED